MVRLWVRSVAWVSPSGPVPQDRTSSGDTIHIFL